MLSEKDLEMLESPMKILVKIQQGKSYMELVFLPSTILALLQ